MDATRGLLILVASKEGQHGCFVALPDSNRSACLLIISRYLCTPHLIARASELCPASLLLMPRKDGCYEGPAVSHDPSQLIGGQTSLVNSSCFVSFR